MEIDYNNKLKDEINKIENKYNPEKQISHEEEQEYVELEDMI